MAIYQVLQISHPWKADLGGDNYDARLIVACDDWEPPVRRRGEHHYPVVAALHPPYKMMGARIGFCFWTALIFLAWS